MHTVDARNAPQIKNPHQVKVSKLHDSEHAQVMHITLKPGESLKRHITPVDVIFYVLEGTGILEIGDEQQEAVADTLIDSPARVPHCWYNRSDQILRVLVVKVPRPTEHTRVL
jgi:quercetin dioxygenase-like cupin family protein